MNMYSLNIGSCRRRAAVVTHAMAKQLHFNKNGEALKRMQAGVDKLASVVGVTLGPKVKTYHMLFMPVLRLLE